MDVNPAWSVRGPRHVVKKGKTPVLLAAEARQLLDSIEMDTLIGLRGRALIALMCHSFARVSAAGKTGLLTPERLNRTDVLRMIKRRALAAGINADRICCHTCRATGITAYLENGGTIEHAQAIAAHESPRTTKLYDRTSDTINLDEIERIAI